VKTIIGGGSFTIIGGKRTSVHSQNINQSINYFICPEIQYGQWTVTGHQGTMQRPLTGARINKVNKINE